MQKTGAARYYTVLIAAAILAATAVWRAVLAVQHYRASLAITDDPSIRELEQLGAFLEAGACLILLVHAAMLVRYSRRPFCISWPFAAVTALLCAGVVAGAFAGLAVFDHAGVYIVAIVAGVAVAALVMRFNWVSLYSGALLGSTLGWLATAPLADLFVGLFVVGPAVIYAFLGGAVASVLKRRQCSHRQPPPHGTEAFTATQANAMSSTRQRSAPIRSCQRR